MVTRTPYVTDPIATDTEKRKISMAKGSVRKKGKKWYYSFYVENERGNLVQKGYAGRESKSENVTKEK